MQRQTTGMPYLLTEKQFLRRKLATFFVCWVSDKTNYLSWLTQIGQLETTIGIVLSSIDISD